MARPRLKRVILCEFFGPANSATVLRAVLKPRAGTQVGRINRFLPKDSPWGQNTAGIERECVLEVFRVSLSRVNGAS